MGTSRALGFLSYSKQGQRTRLDHVHRFGTHDFTESTKT